MVFESSESKEIAVIEAIHVCERVNNALSQPPLHYPTALADTDPDRLLGFHHIWSGTISAPTEPAEDRRKVPARTWINLAWLTAHTATTLVTPHAP